VPLPVLVFLLLSCIFKYVY